MTIESKRDSSLTFNIIQKKRQSWFLFNIAIQTITVPLIFFFAFEAFMLLHHPSGFPGGSVVTNLPANAGDTGSIPGWERFPGGENGNPLQYSFLGNPMDRGAWRATIHGVTKSQTRPSD